MTTCRKDGYVLKPDKPISTVGEMMTPPS
jgi:hypothetical protein